MSNGNGPERECAVVWRNMGGPVLTGKAVSVRLSPIPTSPSKKSPLTGGFFTWRKRWDSNLRARKGYLISSFIAVCYLHSFSCQFQSALYARKPA